jgi:small-conductance mechanosensitive channel
MWWSFLILLLLVAAALWHGQVLDPLVPDGYHVLTQQAITVAVALAAFFFVDRLIRRHYWQGYLKQRRNREAPAVIKDIVTVLLLLLGLGTGLWWLGALSLPVLFAATVALSGVALGVSQALAPVILDLFSGVAINFDRSYTLGDWLTIYSQDPLGTLFGRVTGITWRTTYLRLEDGTQISVPNRLPALNPVINHSRDPQTMEISLNISFDMRVPVHRVVNLILGESLKLVRKPGFACSPLPAVAVNGFTDTCVTYQVRLHIHPDQLLPRDGRSIAFQALQDAIRLTAIPSVAARVEIRKPPTKFDVVYGQDEITEALSRVPLFRDALSPDQARDLVQRCKLREVDENQEVMRQGDQASSLFVILEGAARIWISETAEDCKEVAVLAMGDVVGEMSLLTGAPRNATVTALTRLHTLEITKRAVAELANKSPEILMRFAQILHRRRHELQEISTREAEKHDQEGDLLMRIMTFFFPGSRNHADAK